MSYFAQTVGENMFLEKAMERGRLDLSNEENLELAGRWVIGQIRATQYLAQQIDELRATHGT